MAQAAGFAATVGRLLDRDEAAAVSRRRRGLIEATTSVGDPVAVPANATQALVDAVKACGRRAVFAPIDERGSTVLDGMVEVAAVVDQPIAGVFAGPGGGAAGGPGHRTHGPAVLVDASDTVVLEEQPGVVAAVLGRSEEAVALVQAQLARCRTVFAGLRAAAGLPLVAAVDDVSGPRSAAPVPTGVVVRLPDRADALTFVAYAQAELTPLQWAVTLRPVHPQARRQLDPEQLRSSVEHLCRLIVVPVDPTESDDELAQSVLGIVKAAEYTGWRWCEEPAQAQWYAAFLDDLYGPDHDAYRPAFEIG